MSKKWFVLAVATMMTSSVFAASNNGITPNLDKDTRVLEGAGTFNVMGDELQIQLAYGQLITDKIEVAMLAGLRDSDFYMSTELGVRAEYNLATKSALVPFLSAGVTWVNAEADDFGLDSDAAVFSVGGGVKYFIRNDIALAVNGSYLVATDDIFVDNEDAEVEDDEFRILFSVRSYFD